MMHGLASIGYINKKNYISCIQFTSRSIILYEQTLRCDNNSFSALNHYKFFTVNLEMPFKAKRIFLGAYVLSGGPLIFLFSFFFS